MPVGDGYEVGSQPVVRERNPTLTKHAGKRSTRGDSARSDFSWAAVSTPNATVQGTKFRKDSAQDLEILKDQIINLLKREDIHAVRVTMVMSSTRADGGAPDGHTFMLVKRPERPDDLYIIDVSDKFDPRDQDRWAGKADDYQRLTRAVAAALSRNLMMAEPPRHPKKFCAKGTLQFACVNYIDDYALPLLMNMIPDGRFTF